MSYAQLERNAQANRYLYASRFGRSPLATYPGEKAFLFLEGEQDEQFDPVEAAELAKLLRQHQIPMVLLNACQSGKLSGEMETSLGNRLIQAGVQTVVAMGDRCLPPLFSQDERGTEFGLWLAQAGSQELLG